MPRSLVVVPLGWSAARVPDTSPSSSWGRGRGRSVLSSTVWVAIISYPPPFCFVPLCLGAAAKVGTLLWPLFSAILFTASDKRLLTSATCGCFPREGWVGVSRDSQPPASAAPLLPLIWDPSSAAHRGNLGKGGNNALLAGVFASFSSLCSAGSSVLFLFKTCCAGFLLELWKFLVKIIYFSKWGFNFYLVFRPLWTFRLFCPVVARDLTWADLPCFTWCLIVNIDTQYCCR